MGLTLQVITFKQSNLRLTRGSSKYGCSNCSCWGRRLAGLHLNEQDSCAEQVARGWRHGNWTGLVGEVVLQIMVMNLEAMPLGRCCGVVLLCCKETSWQ